ncbi:MAG: TIGR01620 family protein [Bauldia sp.]
MNGPRRPPQVFRLDEVELETPPAWPVPEESPLDSDPTARHRPRGRLAVGAFLTAVAGLVLLALGLAVERLISDLFGRAGWLGWVGIALAAVAAGAAAAIVLREFGGLRALRRLRHIHALASTAAAMDDAGKARQAIRELAEFYRTRPETAHARQALAVHGQEIIDGRDLIGLGERELLSAFDASARRAVLESAKRVSAITAVSPRAVFNVGFVFAETIRLVRTVARLYGGPSAALGFLKLGSAVAGHLTLTGGLAAGDALVQQLVGHGLAARLSARLAEGLVNGVLTARVGLAAIDVCRPFPFVAVRPPRLTELAAELGRGVTGSGTGS